MKTFLSAILISLIPALLFAQKKAETSKADTTRLEEVVVVSSRFPEKREKVAQAVRIFTASRLQQLNAPTTAEVLQQTPGVLVQKSQMGGGSPVIRGFEASRVLLVVDGVRLNNAIYRSGHLQNAITLDHNSLESMEVGFGPSSVSYGSDALGGVIHFHTKQPKLNNTGVSALSRYASAANEKTGGFSVNVGKRKLASFTNLTYSSFGDLRQGARNYRPQTESWKRRYYVVRRDGRDEIASNQNQNLQKGSGYNQVDVMQKFLYKNNDKVRQVLNLQYSNSSDIPRYDRLAQLQNDVPTYAEWYYGPQRRLMTAYHLYLNGFEGVFNRSNITAAYQKIRESRHDRRLNNANLNNRQEDLDIFSLNADFSRSWTRNELTYGMELGQNSVRSAAYRLNIDTDERTPLDTRYPDGGSQVFSAAAFVSHRYEVSPVLSLNGGARMSFASLKARFNDQTFFPFPFNAVKQDNTALSGNMSLVYTPTSDWKISFIGSTGFRAPNVDDLAKVFESVPGRVIVPNPNLKPEHTYNVEAALERSFRNKAAVNVTGFYTFYRNAITSQPFLFNGESQIIYDGQLSDVTANVNAGRARLYGYSADLSLPLNNRLALNATATYTHARIVSDEPDQPLDHIPPFFANSSIAYRNSMFDAEFFIQYNGMKKLEDYNVNGEDNLAQATPYGMPAWYTFNLRTSCSLNRSLKLQLGLDNILDRNYRVFASGISAPGRNLLIALRGHF